MDTKEIEKKAMDELEEEKNNIVKGYYKTIQMNMDFWQEKLDEMKEMKSKLDNELFTFRKEEGGIGLNLIFNK